MLAGVYKSNSVFSFFLLDHSFKSVDSIWFVIGSVTSLPSFMSSLTLWLSSLRWQCHFDCVLLSVILIQQSPNKLASKETSVVRFTFFVGRNVRFGISSFHCHLMALVLPLNWWQNLHLPSWMDESSDEWRQNYLCISSSLMVAFLCRKSSFGRQQAAVPQFRVRTFLSIWMHFSKQQLN